MNTKKRFILLVFSLLLSIPLFTAEAKTYTTGQGLFTPPRVSDMDMCQKTADAVGTEDELNTKESAISNDGSTGKEVTDNLKTGLDVDKTQKGQGLPEKAVSGILKGALNSTKPLFQPSCDNYKPSALKTLTNTAQPIVITSSSGIMHVIMITQYIAFALIGLFIVFYGLMFQMGKVEMDPVAFLFRLAAVTLAVYYSPYLMQDLLNINNVITDQIATMSVNGVDGIYTAIFGLIFSVIILIITVCALGGVFWIVVGLYLVVMLLKPLIEIFMWWFSRLLMVLFLAALGPLFIVAFILPGTSSFAKKWLMNFFGTVFSQSLLVIGLYFVATICATMGDFLKNFNLGPIEAIVFMYALIFFIGKIPSLVQGLIGGSANEISSDLAKSADALLKTTTSLVGSQIMTRGLLKEGAGVGEAVGQQTKSALEGLKSPAFASQLSKSLGGGEIGINAGSKAMDVARSMLGAGAAATGVGGAVAGADMISSIGAGLAGSDQNDGDQNELTHIDPSDADQAHVDASADEAQESPMSNDSVALSDNALLALGALDSKGELNSDRAKAIVHDDLVTNNQAFAGLDDKKQKRVMTELFTNTSLGQIPRKSKNEQMKDHIDSNKLSAKSGGISLSNQSPSRIHAQKQQFNQSALEADKIMKDFANQNNQTRVERQNQESTPTILSTPTPTPEQPTTLNRESDSESGNFNTGAQNSSSETIAPSTQESSVPSAHNSKATPDFSDSYESAISEPSFEKDELDQLFGEKPIETPIKRHFNDDLS